MLLEETMAWYAQLTLDPSSGEAIADRANSVTIDISVNYTFRVGSFKINKLTLS